MDYIGACEHDGQLDREKEIVIFGCGKIANRIFQTLQRKELAGRVRYFCDNSVQKRGEILHGCKVLSVEEAVRACPDAAYIVASTCVREMAEQLRDLGVKKTHIVF